MFSNMGAVAKRPARSIAPPPPQTPTPAATQGRDAGPHNATLAPTQPLPIAAIIGAVLASYAIAQAQREVRRPATTWEQINVQRKHLTHSWATYVAKEREHMCCIATTAMTDLQKKVLRRAWRAWVCTYKGALKWILSIDTHHRFCRRINGYFTSASKTLVSEPLSFAGEDPDQNFYIVARQPELQFDAVYAKVAESKPIGTEHPEHDSLPIRPTRDKRPSRRNKEDVGDLQIEEIPPCPSDDYPGKVDTRKFDLKAEVEIEKPHQIVPPTPSGSVELARPTDGLSKSARADHPHEITVVPAVPCQLIKGNVGEIRGQKMRQPAQCPLCYKKGHSREECWQNPCAKCGRPGHPATKCKQQPSQKPEAGKGKCGRCGSTIHPTKDCPTFTCSDCQRQGHVRKECKFFPCTKCGMKGHFPSKCSGISPVTGLLKAKIVELSDAQELVLTEQEKEAIRGPKPKPIWNKSDKVQSRNAQVLQCFASDISYEPPIKEKKDKGRSASPTPADTPVVVERPTAMGQKTQKRVRWKQKPVSMDSEVKGLLSLSPHVFNLPQAGAVNYGNGVCLYVGPIPFGAPLCQACMAGPGFPTICYHFKHMRVPLTTNVARYMVSEYRRLQVPHCTCPCIEDMGMCAHERAWCAVRGLVAPYLPERYILLTDYTPMRVSQKIYLASSATNDNYAGMLAIPPPVAPPVTGWPAIIRVLGGAPPSCQPIFVGINSDAMDCPVGIQIDRARDTGLLDQLGHMFKNLVLKGLPRHRIRLVLNDLLLPSSQNQISEMYLPYSVPVEFSRTGYRFRSVADLNGRWGVDYNPDGLLTSIIHEFSSLMAVITNSIIPVLGNYGPGVYDWVYRMLNTGPTTLLTPMSLHNGWQGVALNNHHVSVNGPAKFHIHSTNNVFNLTGLLNDLSTLREAGWVRMDKGGLFLPWVYKCGCWFTAPVRYVSYFDGKLPLASDPKSKELMNASFLERAVALVRGEIAGYPALPYSNLNLIAMYILRAAEMRLYSAKISVRMSDLEEQSFLELIGLSTSFRARTAELATGSRFSLAEKLAIYLRSDTPDKTSVMRVPALYSMVDVTGREDLQAGVMDVHSARPVSWAPEDVTVRPNDLPLVVVKREEPIPIPRPIVVVTTDCARRCGQCAQFVTGDKYRLRNGLCRQCFKQRSVLRSNALVQTLNKAISIHELNISLTTIILPLEISAMANIIERCTPKAKLPRDLVHFNAKLQVKDGPIKPRKTEPTYIVGPLFVVLASIFEQNQRNTYAALRFRLFVAVPGFQGTGFPAAQHWDWMTLLMDRWFELLFPKAKEVLGEKFFPYKVSEWASTFPHSKKERYLRAARELREKGYPKKSGDFQKLAKYKFFQKRELAPNFRSEYVFNSCGECGECRPQGVGITPGPCMASQITTPEATPRNIADFANPIAHVLMGPTARRLTHRLEDLMSEGASVRYATRSPAVLSEWLNEMQPYQPMDCAAADARDIKSLDNLCGSVEVLIPRGGPKLRQEYKVEAASTAYSYWKTFTPASGVDVLGANPQYAFADADIKCMDGSFSQDAFSFSEWFQKKLGANNPTYLEMFKAACTVDGTSMDRSIRLRVDGVNASGRDDTALNNAIINASMVAVAGICSWYSSLTSQPFISVQNIAQVPLDDPILLQCFDELRAMILGDDSLVRLPKDMGSYQNGYVELFARCGFELKMSLKDNLYKTIFLGRRVLPTTAGNWLMPITGRRLYKFGVALDPIKVPNLYGWLKGVAWGDLVAGAGPIHRAVATSVMRATLGNKMVTPQRHGRFLPEKHDRKYPNCNLDTMLCYCSIYGITLEQLLECERFLLSVSHYPSFISHPTLNKILAVDLPLC